VFDFNVLMSAMLAFERTLNILHNRTVTRLHRVITLLHRGY